MEEIWARAIESLDAFSSVEKRTYIFYLISATALAAGVYLFSSNRQMIDKKDKAPKSLKSFVAYLFPKDVYLHPSAKQDYAYFIINGFVHYGVIAAYILATPFFVYMGSGILSAILGPMSGELLRPTLFQIIILTVIFALAYDFGAFFMHYLMHKIPFLWEFHKVHHSAERLTPMTLYRMHPVDMILTGLLIAVMTGLSIGSLIYFWNIEVQFIEILGLNVIIFAYYVFGYNLRHSHIWLNYPKWISYILVSPAQHQIHHSIEKKHWDKNMGLIFAFWDWAFGTLYVPAKNEEKFDYGVRKSNPNPYKSIPSMFLTPFKDSWNVIARKTNKKQTAFNLTILLGIIGFLYFQTWTLSENINASKTIPSTVYLEDLTWSETKKAMDKGFTKIIIPTGGTEQNGFHMILGKHNYVVKHTSGEIAKQIGNTLVAPTISYVPEEVHMNFPGTISVSENTFASILEDSARSLKRHGFTHIFFIGDSSHNQSPQQDVANKLNNEWRAEGPLVYSVSDYYYKNNQTDWLTDNGYSMREIGGHAGIRDTSELLAINKDGIRNYAKAFKNQENTGHNGDFTRANKKYGETMLNLKVQAATNEINSVLETTP